MSERRACRLAQANRSTVRYRSVKPEDIVPRARIKELANRHRRFGHLLPGRRLLAIAERARIHILLRREGFPSRHLLRNCLSDSEGQSQEDAPHLLRRAIAGAKAQTKAAYCCSTSANGHAVWDR
ncbi:MAG: hypothetical protein AAGF25_15320 [Pseudomonadota bacterium]